MKIKKFIAFFAVFTVLIFSGARGTLAALETTSNNMAVAMGTKNLSVEMTDSEGTTLDTLPLGLGKEIGLEYDEGFSISNTGTIDVYLRMVINTQWTDDNGNVLTALNPEYIHYELNLSESDWILSDESTRDEKIYYCVSPLPAQSLTTLTGKSWIDTEVLDISKQNITKSETTDENTGYKAVTTTYQYDLKKVKVSVEIDAVQTHNAESAVASAWGNAARKYYAGK